MNEEIKEDLQIDIKEIPVTESYRVKEQSFIINTGTYGLQTFVTPVINGFLECIILETTGSVQVLITLADKDDVIIYDTNKIDLTGTKYLPIRQFAVDKIGDKFNMSQEKWVLNDRIRVKVVGTVNSETIITFRYC